MNSKRFEIFLGQNENGAPLGSKYDRWYWRLKTANGKIIAIGGEGYRTRRNVRRAVKVCQGEILGAGGQLPIVEVS